MGAAPKPKTDLKTHELFPIFTEYDRLLDSIVDILIQETRYFAWYFSGLTHQLVSTSQNRRLFIDQGGRDKTKVKGFLPPYSRCLSQIPIIVTLNGDRTRDPKETFHLVKSAFNRVQLTRTLRMDSIRLFLDTTKTLPELLQQEESTGDVIQELEDIRAIIGEVADPCAVREKVWSVYYQTARPLQVRVLGAYTRKVERMAKSRAPSEAAEKDYVQWGTLGLMRAFSDYDHTRGSSFPAYAASWINQQILENAKRDSIVGVKSTAWARAAAIGRVKAKLEAEHGPATKEEIAKAAKVTVEQLDAIKLDIAHAQVVSLDAPATDDPINGDRQPTAANIASTNITPEDFLCMDERVDLLLDFIDELDKPQQVILAHELGLEKLIIELNKEKGNYYGLVEHD